MAMETFFMKSVTIRHKLWGGFFVILIVLLVVSIKTLWSVADTQHRVGGMTQDYQPTLMAAMNLRAALKETTTALGFYLLTQRPHYLQSYEDYLRRLDVAIDNLRQTPLLQRDTEVAETVADVEAGLNEFKSYKAKMVQLAQNLTDNFSALGYAGSNINPLSREMLQAISNMLLSEQEEAANAERRKLLNAMADLRYLWSSVINNARIYMFYGNDDALSNVYLFIQGAKDLLAKIQNMGVALTFEQEEAIPFLKDAISKWENHLKAVVDLHKGDKVRMDAYLIRTEVSPVLDRIDNKLQRLSHYLRDRTNNSSQELIAQTQTTTNVVSFLLVAGIGVGIMLAWLMTRMIVTPIRVVAAAMEDIADGDGDLSRRLNVSGSDEVALLASGFNRFVEKTQHIIRQVSESVGQLDAATGEMTHITDTTTRTMMQQKQQTTLVADAVNEMSAAAQEVAQNAEQTAQAAQHADQETHHSRQIVDQAIAGVDELGDDIRQTGEVIQKLGDDVQQIGAVIGVIRDVTEQTNLLALNAAIEAARAGEQGRGFAVVADEVRTLATRTKESTDTIIEKVETLIRDAKLAVDRMQTNTDKAKAVIGLANNAGETLTSVTQAVANINSMTEQIAQAVDQQWKVAQTVNANIENIIQLSDSADQAANQVAGNSHGLQRLSENLNTLVAKFKV
ncbi:MAG: methyl-accepting chemotaxis protein [Gammaproteobacteria bacterium]|jgi:methyl-accepting chemotaxis protein